MGLKKFSSQLDEKVWSDLKALSETSHVDLSDLLSEAVTDLINKKSVRPFFQTASDEAFSQFDEALKELSK